LIIEKNNTNYKKIMNNYSHIIKNAFISIAIGTYQFYLTNQIINENTKYNQLRILELETKLLNKK
jgi:hypothetical protein